MEGKKQRSRLKSCSSFDKEGELANDAETNMYVRKTKERYCTYTRAGGATEHFFLEK